MHNRFLGQPNTPEELRAMIAAETELLRSQVTALQAELAECKRDAERYRLIRKHSGSAMDWDWWTLAKHNHDGLPADELLDAAIDAAREGK